MDPLAQAWTTVHASAQRLRKTPLSELFAGDPDRFARFSVRLDDVLIDLSKEKLDQAAFDSLLALARASAIRERREILFEGGRINETEDRAAFTRPYARTPGHAWQSMAGM